MNTNSDSKKTKQLIGKIREILTSSEEKASDDEVLRIIQQQVFANEYRLMRPVKENIQLVDRIFNAIRKDMDILHPFIEDKEISEIMVNGKDDIFVEKNGRIEKMDMSFDTTEDLEELIRRIAGKVHREINELKPIVDARLPDGSRVNAVYKNIALGGPILTIRKFPENAITMETLIKKQSITKECAYYLKQLVRAGYNCFISGGTSSGKTTFLNVLSEYIPKDERVIVIEDSAELQIRNIKNLVRMECKNANVSGKGNVTMENLIKTSLRMRPDRIIVGEVRGKEVMDMIQACNTGHDGSFSTGHGNNIEGMLRRLESMFLQAADFPIEAIRSQIAEGIDVIIHLGRFADGSRKVLEVSEIKGLEKGQIATNSIFKFKAGRGLIKTGNELYNTEKLQLKGITV